MEDIVLEKNAEFKAEPKAESKTEGEIEDKSTSSNEYVNRYYFEDGKNLPLVIEANTPNLDLVSFYQSGKNKLDQELLENGALLFRGFNIASVEAFELVVEELIGTTTPYLGGATPRKNLSNKVATSTEFPKEQEIKLHNELSYEPHVPKRLAFCCLKAPECGGQTQIADVKKVLEYVDPKIVAEFESRGGWKLIRNFGMGFGPTVEQGFGTNDLEAIKVECARRDIKLEIIKDDLIRTTQYSPAIKRHPQTNDQLWINHIVFWHTSSMPEAYLQYMSQAFQPEEFPYLTLFADGTAIPDEYAENIREAYAKAETYFDWKQSDVMLVDNFKVAHGRKPFDGERLIVVSMG